jgi:hypothetical protein
MPALKRYPRSHPCIWRIDRVFGATTEYVGVVTALDADAAIERACEKFSITNPEDQRQLIACKL